MKHFFLAATILTVVSGQAVSQEDNTQELLAALESATAKIEALSKEVLGLKDRSVGSSRLPKGAVVAFDRDDGCPAGWSDVGKDESERFAGRTFIAVGPHVQRGVETTQKRAHNDQGGEEAIKLTVDQLPKHTHNITLDRRWGDKSHQHTGWGSDDGNHGASAVKTDSGNGLVGNLHNNMPPYIALYFCKKS